MSDRHPSVARGCGRGARWAHEHAWSSTRTSRAVRLGTWAMTKDALLRGFEHDHGFYGRLKGHDIARFRAGTRRYVSITHPEHIDHVLHGAVERYHKSYEYELLKSVLHVSLFTDEGDSWRRHRRMLTPMFAKRHLNGLIDLMIDPIEQARERIERGETDELEMVGEMVTVTLDVVGNALFSQQFLALTEIGEVVTRGLRTAEAMGRVLLVAAPPRSVLARFQRGLHRAPRIPGPLSGAQLVGRTLDRFVWRVVRERQANPRESPDLLNHLLSASDGQGSIPVERVRNEALTFMLAGHETTANAMSWMWYLLALNPDARTRMLAEVDSVLKGRRPTVDDLARLEWTAACVQEAMRYFSPAWVLPRVAIEDDEIGGHRVAKGTTVMIPVHLVHHDQRWWPDPGRYDPERFLGDKAKRRHRSAYLPFGGGRRVCIGTSFALMEATLITAILSQRFVFDLVPGHPVEPETTLTLRPRYGLKVTARRRLPADAVQ